MREALKMLLKVSNIKDTNLQTLNLIMIMMIKDRREQQNLKNL